MPERLLRALPGRKSAVHGHGHGSPGRLRLGPDLTLRPALVSGVDVTTAPPFTLTYHIRPEARWSDGTPVSSRDFVFTHRTSLSDRVELFPAYAEALAQVESVTRARRQDREGGAPLPLRRLAALVPVCPPGACARRRRLRHCVERQDRRSAHGTLDRKRPFPCRAWERGREITSSATRATGEPGRRISIGSCSGSGRTRKRRSSGCGGTSLTSSTASRFGQPGPGAAAAAAGRGANSSR